MHYFSSNFTVYALAFLKLLCCGFMITICLHHHLVFTTK